MFYGGFINRVIFFVKWYGSFFLKFIRSRRVLASLFYNDCAFLFRLLWSSAGWIKTFDPKSPLKLEFGSGSRKGTNGWKTVDLFGGDLTADAGFSLPLADCSVEQIYSSHMLEHLDDLQCSTFLRECFRILKVGGEFRICVPDARIFIDNYLAGTGLAETSIDLYGPAVPINKAPMQNLNYIAYMRGHHKQLFDIEYLTNALQYAGFNDIQVSDYDPSLDIDDRSSESIYVNVIK